MNKIQYPAIIVVEGTSDEALISSFMDADIVVTNGSDVPRETIEYLKEAKKKRDIVVLTDPDCPGKRIRDILNREIPGLLHAFVLKEHAIKHRKVGVAESSKEDVLDALSHIVPTASSDRGKLTMADLVELGLMGEDNSSSKRAKLERVLHLGHTNAKTLLKRVNALALTKEELQEALEQDE